ncbi:MAG: hypothetical protein B5M52_01195 [Helicobacteraceae bacterium 4484_230]|nr:MAG: hypothetical protein B5M52_01195 [Helicobacteraceae bacterium 4484_230]
MKDRYLHISLPTAALLIVLMTGLAGCGGGGGSGSAGSSSSSSSNQSSSSSSNSSSIQSSSSSTGSSNSAGTQNNIITSTDKNASLLIPEGTADPSTVFSVTKNQNEPEHTVGNAYTLSPEGVHFNKPVTLTLSYTNDDVPAGAQSYELKMGRESAGEWQTLDSAVHNPFRQTFSADLTGFSTYGIFWPDAPDNDDEKQNIINRQIVLLLDAIRDFNTGMLMMDKGYESNSTNQYDPDKTDYSEDDRKWISAGMAKMAEEFVKVQKEANTLYELENGNTPKTVARGFWHNLSEAVLNKVVPFRKRLYDAAERYKDFLLSYIGFSIDNMTDTSVSECELVCCFNHELERSFGKRFSDEEGEDLCFYEDPTTLKQKMYDILEWMIYSDEMGPHHIFRLVNDVPFSCSRYLDMDEWNSEYKALITSEIRKTYQEGLKVAWNAAKKSISPGSKITGYVLTGAEIAYKKATKNAGQYPRGTAGFDDEVPADAVVYLVPNEANSTLPILTEAMVVKDGKMHIVEPYAGNYQLYLYSRGNYPVTKDDVNLSSGNSAVTVDEPTVIYGVKKPLFGAVTTGDPHDGMVISVVATCPGCEKNEYYISHTAKTTSLASSSLGGSGSHQYSTESGGSFDFGNDWTATFEIPYIVKKRFSPFKDDAGGIIFRKPSKYTLSGTAEWDVRKIKEEDGRICYYAYTSTKDEDTQYGKTYVTSDGVTFLANKSAEVTTWGDTGFFPKKELLGCGELPITYSYNHKDSAAGISTEWDIEVTISKK